MKINSHTVATALILLRQLKYYSHEKWNKAGHSVDMKNITPKNSCHNVKFRVSVGLRVRVCVGFRVGVGFKVRGSLVCHID